ncbi:uncharacterized protein LOC124930068 [Impatiens glandulifera]|uniref:uncharacterized protein LOC124930068 n=1 Tax=Impatiens glandulifera TaxID=253017 RepID=UPI001FB14E12|nr:uncharacterized protein LOC124930068 [Impatiens glandulifera]
MADPEPQSQTTTVVAVTTIPPPNPNPNPSPPPEKPPRKFPAPCWTQEETLALIESYKDRWYALRRGYLRTADWDAVSASIATRCPAQGLPKTSAQCRHKMEKLRQRYRTEKQRSLSLTGRFLSSWFFFDNMDSMENGPNHKKLEHGIESAATAGGGGVIRIKTVNDRDFPDSLLGINNCTSNNNNNKKKQLGGGGKSTYGHHDGTDPGDQNSAILGIRAAAKGYSPNFDPRTANIYSSSSSYVYDDDLHVNGKKPGKNRAGFDFNNTINNGAGIIGFSANLPVNHNIVYAAAAGYGAKKTGKVYVNNPDHDYQQHNNDGSGGLCLKISGERISVPSVLRMKECDGGNPFDDRRKMENRGVFKKRKEGCPISEMASSIKMLGEGFVKMEKMKMEMAREVEKTRMEMEMKRNELILESQRQIVDAFLTVLLETKKKKKKKPDETQA